MFEKEYLPKEKEQDFGYIFNLVNAGVPIDKAIDSEEKFRDGRYTHPDFCFEAESHHRIHTSVTEPSLFAYFPEPTSEKAVKIRKGKYYQKFFPSMLPEDVSELVSLDNDTKGKVVVATSEEDIIDAYLSLGDDFSCMRHVDCWYYESVPGLEKEKHPVALYGRCKNARIGVAKIYDGKKRYFARALVNLDTMKHSSVYDKDGSGMAYELLLEGGFSPFNSILAGCEFEAKNKTEDSSGFVYQICPYIDGHDSYSIGLIKDNSVMLVEEFEKLRKITTKTSGLKPCGGTLSFDFSKHCTICGTRVKSTGPDICRRCETHNCKLCGKEFGKLLKDHLGYCPGCWLKQNNAGNISTTISGKNISVEIEITRWRRAFRITHECKRLRAMAGIVARFYSGHSGLSIEIHSQYSPQVTPCRLFLQGESTSEDNNWFDTDGYEDVLIEAVNHLNSIDFGTFIQEDEF